MKKTFLLATMALFATTFFAQTIQTKTENLGDNVVVTYSYYLNDKGEEVKHGKFSITETPVNNNACKGKKAVSCAYQHDKLTGTFTYSCEMSHYEEFYDQTKGVEYNVSKDNFKINTVWKKVRDQKEGFMVDMYEGYLNGNINISASARFANYQLLTVTGKAEKGVLVDGATCELKENGQTMETYINVAPDFNNAKYVDYKAGQKYTSGQYCYNQEGIVIEFGFSAPRYTFVLKYPRYSKPFIKLGDIDYWDNYQSGKCKTLLDSIIYLELIRDGAAPTSKNANVEYDLLQEDIEMVSHLVDSLRNIETQRKQNVELQKANRLQRYEELFPKVKECYNECEEVNGNRLKALYGRTECALYVSQDGKVIPVMLDLNVENIICNDINRHREYIITNGAKIPMQRYNHYSKYNGKERINDGTVIEQYELDTLENYLKRISIERIDTLKQLRRNAPRIIAESQKVAMLYSKTTSTYTSYKSYKRENCTIKITKKPIIYNAYMEVAAYLYKGDKMNLTELLEANSVIDQLNDRMIQYAKEKTKDLEKALNVASTPEEKLKLLLNQ